MMLYDFTTGEPLAVGTEGVWTKRGGMPNMGRGRATSNQIRRSPNVTDLEAQRTRRKMGAYRDANKPDIEKYKDAVAQQKLRQSTEATMAEHMTMPSMVGSHGWATSKGVQDMSQAPLGFSGFSGKAITPYNYTPAQTGAFEGARSDALNSMMGLENLIRMMNTKAGRPVNQWPGTW